MINIEGLKKYCCEDISKIENYEQALADETQMWDCHHRWEIFMMWRIPVKDLKEGGLYYNQPADRLILLPHSEHMILHHKGKKVSEETRRRLSESHKGKPSWSKGKKLSEEIRRKLSEAAKRRKHSEETRRKIAETLKGRRLSEEHRRKISEAQKGKKMSESARRKMSEARKKHWENKRRNRI